MSSWVFKNGPATVRVSKLGEELARRVFDQVYPGVVAKVEEAIAEVRADAVRQWPVGRRDSSYLKRYPNERTKPHSRDMFESEMVLEQSRTRLSVRGRVWNRASYWLYIKPRRLARGSAVVEFVRKPLRQRRADLEHELWDVIKRGLRG